MKGKCIAAAVLMGVLCFLITRVPAVASREKDEINTFYRSLVDILKKPSPLKDLVALVEKNPPIATQCLEAIREKAQVPGKKGEALGVVHGELQAALLLSSKSPTCDEVPVKSALELIAEEQDDDARIGWLKRLVTQCPRAGRPYSILGDLCFKQSRWGEAIAAYKKAVALTGDEDSRLRLQKAMEQHEAYVKKKPLQRSDIKNLVSRERDAVITTMGPGGIVQKARVGNTIQRQVRFDEWSDKIKGEFLPDLKVIGEGLKEELSKHADVRLVIEGHTDKRGPLERNMKLSKDRAEAVKNHLVANYGIDPSRLVTEGYGPKRPYSEDEDEAGYALNRRVQLRKLDSED